MDDLFPLIYDKENLTRGKKILMESNARQKIRLNASGVLYWISVKANSKVMGHISEVLIGDQNCSNFVG